MTEDDRALSIAVNEVPDGIVVVQPADVVRRPTGTTFVLERQL